MKKILLTLSLLLLCCAFGYSQRKLSTSTLTLNYSPWAYPSCTYTVDVYMVSEDGFMYFTTPVQTATFTGGTASTVTMTFNAPAGSTGFVPGDYYVHVYSSGVNFNVPQAGNAATASTITVPYMCGTESNCKTDWLKVNTNSFTLRPRCTVGGI